ncbi:NADP-dependent oxidoreductase [Amycolatopsis sacchari]|uniref:NADP-dependent oxidoreductase n=1 Tax=Amycolatopsis sacchari TaxID=115433 RepID=UPI003EBB6A7F
MRAVRFAEFGGPEVLRVADVAVPEPGPGQVRVAVRFAGVNPVDWKIRSGLFGGSLSRPRGLGQELAGVVDAVGPGAALSAGDEVFGWAIGGSYAEYALASAVFPKPPGMSWQDAAALPVAGEAALRGLRELAVRSGEVLLITGASGAVGSLATQLAVRRGIRVVGTAGDPSFVESLGATGVRYGPGLVERVRALVSTVDAVFDAAGHGMLPDALELRGSADRVLTIADPEAESLGVPFSGGTPDTTTPEVLRELAEAYTAGNLRIQHAATFPLEEAAEAHRLSQTGHARGKITLAVS